MGCKKPVYLIALALLTAPPGLSAKVVDEAILDKLEQAQGREQLDIARTIGQRLQEGRPPPATQKRLVELITGSPALVQYGQLRMLHYLGPGSELDEATIIAVAAGLSSTIVPRANDANYLERLLIGYNNAHRLPDAAIANLYSALEPTESIKPAHAIEVLKTIPTDDVRYEENTAAISAALQLSQSYVRKTAAQALASIGDKARLPLPAISALTESALTDTHIHVRVEALAALAYQDVDRGPLTRAFARELTEPTPEIWEASKGISGQHTVRPRAITLLIDSLEPPFPDYAVDALIAQTERHFDTTLPFLELLGQTGTFSEAQRHALDSIANRHGRAEVRERLYAMLAKGTQGKTVDDLLESFELDRSKTAQLKAGYSLQRRYREQVVPARVAEVAERVMLNSNHRELRGLGAELLTNAETDVTARKRAFLAAMREHSNDASAAEAWLQLHDDQDIEALVVNYVNDSSLRPWLRTRLVNRLKDLALPGKHLQATTVNALTTSAATTDSYILNSTILTTLHTWNADVPLTVKLNNKQFLTTWSSRLYTVLAIAFIIGSAANLVAAITVPLRGGKQGAKRTGLLLLWLALSLAGLALFVVAFVGFLGHNSAPDPRFSIKLNIPMYIGMVVFLAYTAFNLRWSRRRSKAQSLATS